MLPCGCISSAFFPPRPETQGASHKEFVIIFYVVTLLVVAHCSTSQKYSSHSLPLNWAYREFLKEDSVKMLGGCCLTIASHMLVSILIILPFIKKKTFSAAHKNQEPALPLPTQVRGPHSLIAFGKDAITIAFTFITDQVRQIKKVGW